MSIGADFDNRHDGSDPGVDFPALNAALGLTAPAPPPSNPGGCFCGF